MRDRMGIYRGSHGAHIQNVTRTSFGTYNLIHQFGASLTSDLAQDAGTQEVTLAFNKGPIQYNAFRQEVKVLMEQVAEQMYLAHASFWQRKLGLCTGKEFVLRLPLPVGKLALPEGHQHVCWDRASRERNHRETWQAAAGYTSVVTHLAVRHTYHPFLFFQDGNKRDGITEEEESWRSRDL